MIGFLLLFMINYKIEYIELIMFLLITLLLTTYYRHNDLKKLVEYIKDIIKQKKVFVEHLLLHISWAFILTLIFLLLAFNNITSLNNIALSFNAIALYVFLTGIVVSFLSRADPELSRYLFPWLELRLMSVGGLVIGLARGGCLRWTMVGVAPEGRDIVIRDEDCEVVVSPYVEQKESRPQCVLCGPACPPLRIIGGERVAVRVKDGQKECYYYVADSR
ncbi:MAG: hypothetical protein ACO2PN_21395 [Pyrobaculum sp.]